MPPQNIYDNTEFYSSYIQLPRQKHGLSGAPEWPQIQALLPGLRERRVVDLGCGMGYFSRYARENGAASVLGIDVSENMIARAKSSTSDDAIEYQISDLDTLELPSASFDLAYSALTFHYIEDFSRLVRMIYQSLNPDAFFIFEIEHPIFLAPLKPSWVEDGSGKTSWAVNSYSHEGERTRNWFVEVSSNDP